MSSCLGFCTSFGSGGVCFSTGSVECVLVPVLVEVF